MTEKICTKCKELKPLTEFFKRKDNKTGRGYSSCKKCCGAWCKEYVREKQSKKEGYIFYHRASNIINTKKRNRGLPVMDNLQKHLEDLWAKSQLCYYTGEQMTLFGYKENAKNLMTIDRIIPEKGYVEGNIVLCCSIVNKVKTNLTLAELLELCTKISKYTTRTENS